MSWLQRRRAEALLIQLAERFGRSLDPLCAATGTAGMTRREKIELGQRVAKDMALFQRMRDAGVVTRIDGVEMSSVAQMVDAINAPEDRRPSSESTDRL